MEAAASHSERKIPVLVTDRGGVLEVAQETGLLLETPSPRSYARAVILSSLFGWLGVQHFYLGRWAEALLDVGLSLGWICAFLFEQTLLGAVFFLADFGHATFSTILLLVGGYRDGDSLRVCYPGQRLRPRRIG